jgi:hypothetical protein
MNLLTNATTGCTANGKSTHGNGRQILVDLLFAHTASTQDDKQHITHVRFSSLCVLCLRPCSPAASVVSPLGLPQCHKYAMQSCTLSHCKTMPNFSILLTCVCHGRAYDGTNVCGIWSHGRQYDLRPWWVWSNASKQGPCGVGAPGARHRYTALHRKEYRHVDNQPIFFVSGCNNHFCQVALS